MNEWNKLFEGLFEGSRHFADALMRENNHENSEKAGKANNVNLWRSKPELQELNSLLDSASKYRQELFNRNKKLLEIYKKLINPAGTSLGNDTLKDYYKLLGFDNNYR